MGGLGGSLRKQNSPRAKSGMRMKSNLYSELCYTTVLLGLLVRALSLPLRLGLLFLRPVGTQRKDLLAISRRVFVWIHGLDVWR